jgi:hypothetical protein
MVKMDAIHWTQKDREALKAAIARGDSRAIRRFGRRLERYVGSRRRLVDLQTRLRGWIEEGGLAPDWSARARD